MNENIDLCEILKDCPKGMGLNCTIWDNVEFDHIDVKSNYPIYIKKSSGEMEYLTESGCLNFDLDAKCVIFPKGKTTWKGFIPPYDFKDGDIIYNQVQQRICIYYHGKDEPCFPSVHYCRYNEFSSTFELLDNKLPIAKQNYCLASEEKKQKLFQAIKDNGYKWNVETKTLEKVKTCSNCKVFENMSQNCPYSPVWTCSDLNKAKSRLKDETNCEFWVEIQKTESLKGFATPCKFKAGDVIVSERGNIVLFSHIDSKDFVHYHCIISTYGNFRIEENTNVGVGRYYDCVLANEQQKQRMYYRIKCSGYKYNQSINKLEKINPKFKIGDIIWNKNSYKVKITDINTEDGFYTYESSFAKGIGTITFIDQDDWELVEYRVGDHFIDPKNNNVFVITKIENNGNYNIESLGGLCYIFEMRKTDIDKYTKIHHWSPEWLKPFDKVLVRDTPHDFWVATLFSHIGSSKDFPYITSYTNTRYCIPYNSETEHLVGTTLEEPEFYKL